MGRHSFVLEISCFSELRESSSTEKLFKKIQKLGKKWDAADDVKLKERKGTSIQITQTNHFFL